MGSSHLAGLNTCSLKVEQIYQRCVTKTLLLLLLTMAPACARLDLLEMTLLVLSYDQFVDHILSQESTKSIYGKAVTGRTFLILVETYLETIKNGAVPSVETAVDYMAASENQKEKEAAVEAYNKEIQDLILPVPSQQLLDIE